MVGKNGVGLDPVCCEEMLAVSSLDCRCCKLHGTPQRHCMSVVVYLPEFLLSSDFHSFNAFVFKYVLHCFFDATQHRDSDYYHNLAYSWKAVECIEVLITAA